MLENTGSLNMFVVLSIGLVFGLRHATEVDHVVAIWTVVSRHGNVFRSAVVGALWGVGHTVSLLVIGAIVLSLRISIPQVVSNWLEFAVALMIIGLGVSALWRASRNSSEVHIHQHKHDGVSHTHDHFHEKENEHQTASHAAHSPTVSRVGWKPVLIGMVHGLPGSGPLAW